jgi:hypothetical protein
MRKKEVLILFEILLIIAVIVGLAGFAQAATQTLNFAWGQPAVDTQKANFGGWKLYGKTKAETTFRVLATINYAGTQQTTYTSPQPIDSPAGAETEWTFYVTAIDKAGNESGPSNQVAWVVDLLAPGNPFNLIITIVPTGS